MKHRRMKNYSARTVLEVPTNFEKVCSAPIGPKH